MLFAVIKYRGRPTDAICRSSLRLDRDLSSEAELLYDSAVTLDIVVLKIAEKIAAVADHLVKTAAAVVVLLVDLKVLGEGVDAMCEDRDLNLGRTCVALVCLVSLDDSLLFCLSDHFVSPHKKYFSVRRLRLRRVNRCCIRKSARRLPRRCGALSEVRANGTKVYYTTKLSLCKYVFRFYFRAFFTNLTVFSEKGRIPFFESGLPLR